MSLDFQFPEADPNYPHLFSPWQVGKLRIPNRLVMGAMHTGLERLDRREERIGAFYRARAEGGAGLIITGGVSPNREGRLDPEAPYLEGVRDEAWHRAIVQAVHGTETLVCMQLLHAGRYARLSECVGASDRKAPINPYAPAALANEGVWRTIEDFARSAQIAHSLGYHGVEIMGSEGYLINQFTALTTNERSDEFGGSLDARAKLACEVVKAIRQRVPEDFLVIYRISAVDLVPNGMTGEETRYLAAMVEHAGASMLNTGIGWHESKVPTIAAPVPRAAWSYAIGQLKDAVTIPVIASNRINDPAIAEQLLCDGVADFISMARPLLADPFFAAKAKANRPDTIATCIACNQACLDRALTGGRVSCMINPMAGYEVERVAIPALVRKRIAVVGGGAAGMNFAFQAASRGHMVTLFEAGQQLGGQLLMAREIPGKSEFNEALRYFKRRLIDEDVTVHLDHAGCVEELSSGRYDDVVIATGVTSRRLAISGIDDPRVLTYQDVLQHRRPVGKAVAIIGAGGIGFDVAEFLLETPGHLPHLGEFAQEYGLDLDLCSAGGLADRPAPSPPPLRQITLLQRKRGKPAGIASAVSTRWIHRGKLERAKVEMVGGVEYRRVVAAGLVVSVEGEERTIAADTIIICAGQEPVRALYEALIIQMPAERVHLIGGANDAGELDATRAIEQATSLALAI